MSKYILANLIGMDPRLVRVLQDLADRINFVTERLESAPRTISTEDFATRENPSLGIVTIPTRNDGGMDGYIRVSKDGVIVNYSSPSESLFPYVDITDIGNVGAGLDSLHSFSLPSNSLERDGDVVEYLYAGGITSNDNNKRLQTSIDGQGLENTGLIDIDAGWWRVSGTYTRKSSTTIFAEAHIVFGFLSQLDGAGVQTGSSQRHIARNALLTVADLNLNAVTMLVEAEAVADDDVTQNLSIIKLSKARTVKRV